MEIVQTPRTRRNFWRRNDAVNFVNVSMDTLRVFGTSFDTLLQCWTRSEGPTILDKSYETKEKFDAFTGSKRPPSPVSMLFEVLTHQLSPKCIWESFLNNIDMGGRGLQILNTFFDWQCCTTAKNDYCLLTFCPGLSLLRMPYISQGRHGFIV